MPSPHTVLAITHAVPGGTTSFVFDYAFWLKQKGFRVTVVAGPGEWLFERCQEADIPCLRAPFLQREIQPWLDLLAIFSLARLFHQLKPDVVHLNSSKMSVVGSLAARIVRVPRVVYCIGGWAFLESIAPWKKRFFAIAERLTAKLKDVIICLHPGDKAAAEARHILPRHELVVIPNGVNLQALDHARLSRIDAREALGIPQDQFVFGTIANFYPAKNLPVYIHAAARFLHASPSASVVLIGDGMERSHIEQAILQEHLTERVYLAGAKPHASNYLSAFDVFVLPSTKEGMPFSTLEAMAARLPCIVTDVGAHPWMLRETGSWIIPVDALPNVSNILLEAIQQRGKLVEIGENNRTQVERHFPLEKTFSAHLALCLSQPK